MDEYLFISQDYLTENSIINNNVDYKILRPTIIMAQDIYLDAVLGTPLYEDLCTKGLAVTLNANEILLIKKYIQKPLLWYVLMESTPEFKFKYMNKGIMVKSSENSQGADTKDIMMLMDHWRVKAEAYAEKLTRYLKANVTKFPKYNEYTETGTRANNGNYTTGFYLDDYEENDWTRINNGNS